MTKKLTTKTTTSKRKSISKKTRFEIFKRDTFECVYCGNKPPNAILEIDHILPISKGGLNELENLITSCFDCNRGKSNTSLKNIPNTLIERSKILKEKQDQYKEYQKLLRLDQNRLNREINKVEDIYNSSFDKYVFSEKFKLSVKRFLFMLGFDEVRQSMELSCLRKYHDSEDALKYFCGICWMKIKERDL